MGKLIKPMLLLSSSWLHGCVFTNTFFNNENNFSKPRWKPQTSKSVWFCRNTQCEARNRQLSASCDECILSLMGFYCECICVNLFLLQKCLVHYSSFSPRQDASAHLQYASNLPVTYCNLTASSTCLFLSLFLVITRQYRRLRSFTIKAMQKKQTWNFQNYTENAAKHKDSSFCICLFGPESKCDRLII